MCTCYLAPWAIRWVATQLEGDFGGGGGEEEETKKKTIVVYSQCWIKLFLGYTPYTLYCQPL